METIRMKGNLTPDFVNNKLGPFLQTISNIQHTIDQIKQIPPTSIKIIGINWENIDIAESDAWSDIPPVVTVDLNQAKMAVGRLREAFDSLDEESSSQATRLAQARMIRSICDSLVAAIDIEAHWNAIAKWEKAAEIDDMEDLIRWYESGILITKDARSNTQETLRLLGSRYEEAEKALRTKGEEK